MTTDEKTPHQLFIGLITSKADLQPYYVARVKSVDAVGAPILEYGFRHTVKTSVLHLIRAREGDLLAWGTADFPDDDHLRNWGLALVLNNDFNVFQPISPQLAKDFLKATPAQSSHQVAAALLRLKGEPLP